MSLLFCSNWNRQENRGMPVLQWHKRILFQCQRLSRKSWEEATEKASYFSFNHATIEWKINKRHYVNETLDYKTHLYENCCTARKGNYYLYNKHLFCLKEETVNLYFSFKMITKSTKYIKFCCYITRIFSIPLMSTKIKTSKPLSSALHYFDLPKLCPFRWDLMLRNSLNSSRGQFVLYIFT